MCEKIYKIVKSNVLKFDLLINSQKLIVSETKIKCLHIMRVCIVGELMVTCFNLTDARF